MTNRPATWFMSGGLLVLLVGTGVDGRRAAAQIEPPTVLGQVGGAAYDVVVSGHLAYLAVDRRVMVLDVEDPAAPLRLGQTPPLSSQLGNVALVGDYVLALGQSDHFTPQQEVGLHVIDVSDPAAPREVAYEDVAGTPFSLDVSDGYAYVTSLGTGLVVIDVRRPDAPRTIATLPPTDNGRLIPFLDTPVEVAVAGRYALLLEEAGQREYWGLVLVIDVSNPSLPRHVGTYLTAGGSGAELPEEVVVDGAYAYIAEGRDISVVSLADPTAPTRVASVQLDGTDIALERDGTRMVLSDSRLYLVGGTKRLYVIDVADPTRPRLLGTRDTAGLPFGVAVDGQRAYVANGGDDPRWPVFHGLEVFDVGDPMPPRKLGHDSREAWVAMDVAIQDGRAYVAAGGAGLRVVDTADPTAPKVIGDIELGAAITAVLVDESRVFLGDGSSGHILHVVDATDPTSPRLLATLDDPAGAATALAATTDILYVGLSDGGVVVVDVSIPAAPRAVATVELPGAIGDLVISDGYLFARTAPGRLSPPDTPNLGIYVLSIADPAAPSPVARVDAPSEVGAVDLGLAVDGGWTFSPVFHGLQVNDLRDPTAPGIVFSVTLDLYSEAWSIAALRGAIVKSERRGVSFIDAADPSRPYLAGSILWPSRSPNYLSQGVALGDGLAYVAQRNAGLLVIGFTPPALPTSTASPSATTTSSATASPPMTWTPTATITDSPEAPATETGTATETATAAATATITAIATATVTSTASPTSTPSQVPPATRSPQPTAGPHLEPLYLPLLLTEQCPPRDVFTDIALVADASTSMRETTTAGRTKLELATAAMGAFADSLRLYPGGDRVAVIVFNDQAHVLQPLTSDRGLISSALGRIVLQQYSRIDLGLQSASRELLAARRSGQPQALILLSDGIANPVGPATVAAAARDAREAGILLYVIGFGPKLDEGLLRAIAGDDRRYVAASDTRLLAGIFRELTTKVPCPPHAFWGRR